MEEKQTHPWVVPLGTIWTNQNWSNDFSRPFSLNDFTTIILKIILIKILKIYWNKKDDNCNKFVFLIVMAPSKTMFLNFENS
jgi:hypothetical protein